MTTIREIAGVGRVEFPDGMSGAQIDSAIAGLQSRGAPDSPPPSVAEPSSIGPFSGVLQPPLGGLPNAFQRTIFNTAFGPLPDQDREGFATETLPALGATAASALFPPAIAARGLPVLARLARIAPNVVAAGAGGGVGGAIGAALQGGNSIAARLGRIASAAMVPGAGAAAAASQGGEDLGPAALSSGARMAAAEALGMGAAGAARRVVAPAAGLLDDVGRGALRFARENFVPGERTAILGRQVRPSLSPADVAPGGLQKSFQSVADFLIPARVVTQRQRRRVAEKVLALPPHERNELVRRLVSADTRVGASDTLYDLPKATDVAQGVAGAIGMKNAMTLGFERHKARDFIRGVIESGDQKILMALRNGLPEKTFNDALGLHLEAMINASTRKVKGQRVIDGEELLAAWQDLPKATKAFFPAEKRKAFENFASFAAASQRVPEAAAEGIFEFGPAVVTTSVLGGTMTAGLGVDLATGGALGGGVAALTARSLMNPEGLLNRWLTSEALPPEVARVAGRELTKLLSRKMIADAASDDDPEGEE